MKVGFTTSFPVEVVFAAGHTPVDMNNLFVLGDSLKLIEIAELDGYPRNVCSWIKGMYGVVSQAEIDSVIGIVGGDCSNTHSLMATLKDKGIDVFSFSFPYNKEKDLLKREIERLEYHFGVTSKQTYEAKAFLDNIRKKLIEADRLTWETGQITGAENHINLVCASDFNGDPVEYEKKIDELLLKAKERPADNKSLRMGFIGVPPIFTDLYDVLENCDIKIVFNEIQRQFAMPYLEKDIVDQYLKFTYPYSVFDRLKDINLNIEKRKIDGILNYTQAFCHRQIDAVLLKKYIEKPVLSIEGDQPDKTDARTILRLESFIDMLEY
ncbi:MAG: 2-hydroxyglutaryl-CoA dehydratase [Candidatus Cloacimonadota bacterium]|nr:MAG: 2-hydroxyglutaryl-CoA dehydratase [Candidatus Cloacimonadota bacterium]